MLNRIAHLESVLEFQKEQVCRQAKKINEVWSILQGPGSTCEVISTDVPHYIMTPQSLPAPVPQYLPLAQSQAPPVPVAPGITHSITAAAPPPFPAAPSDLSSCSTTAPPTKRGTKRATEATAAPSKVAVKNKRRKSIRATKKFTRTLCLSPICSREKAKASTKRSECAATSPTPLNICTPEQRFHSIIPVLSPPSRAVCSQLSQCHTYSAVSKLISAQGGDLTSLRERFAILCALGEKVTKQGSSSSTANNKWYRNFLACSGAVEALVLWLKDFCKHYYFVIDEKLAMVTQYMNGINANASGVVDSLQICGLTNKYIEVLVFILEEAHWSASIVLSTRVDRCLKELYKSLTKYSTIFTEQLKQPHTLPPTISELVRLYAGQLLRTAALLKAPWEGFRRVMQTAEEEEEDS